MSSLMKYLIDSEKRVVGYYPQQVIDNDLLILEKQLSLGKDISLLLAQGLISKQNTRRRLEDLINSGARIAFITDEEAKNAFLPEAGTICIDDHAVYGSYMGGHDEPIYDYQEASRVSIQLSNLIRLKQKEEFGFTGLLECLPVSNSSQVSSSLVSLSLGYGVEELKLNGETIKHSPGISILELSNRDLDAPWVHIQALVSGKSWNRWLRNKTQAELQVKLEVDKKVLFSDEKSVVFRWQALNADEAYLHPFGPVDPHGSKELEVEATTEVYLEAKGLGKKLVSEPILIFRCPSLSGVKINAPSPVMEVAKFGEIALPEYPSFDLGPRTPLQISYRVLKEYLPAKYEQAPKLDLRSPFSNLQADFRRLQEDLGVGQSRSFFKKAKEEGALSETFKSLVKKRLSDHLERSEK